MQLGTLYTSDPRSPDNGRRVQVIAQYRGVVGCLCTLETGEVVRVVISDLFPDAELRYIKGELSDERLIEGWVEKDKKLESVSNSKQPKRRTFWEWLFNV